MVRTTKTNRLAGAKPATKRVRRRLSPEAEANCIPPEAERPTKMTDHMLSTIQAHCRTINSIQEIAELCGIQRTTIQTWRGKFPWFRVLMDQWRADGKHEVVDRLFAAMRRGERWAIELVLARRHPDYRKTSDDAADDDNTGDSGGEDADFSYL